MYIIRNKKIATCIILIGIVVSIVIVGTEKLRYNTEEKIASENSFSIEEIIAKEEALYPKVKDDILQKICIDDSEIEEARSSMISVNESQISKVDFDEGQAVVLSSGKTVFILKDDIPNYKIGQEKDGAIIQDIRKPTEDEIRTMIKEKILIRKVEDELHKRAIDELKKNNK